LGLVIGGVAGKSRRGEEEKKKGGQMLVAD
jgi:hypothetical protein